MLSLGFNSAIFWSLLLPQIPFLICATWILPREWKKIKSAFTEKIYQQIWSAILLNFVLVLLLNLLGGGSISKQVLTFRQIGPLATFFLTCLVAPVAEECFFRYLIFANFAKDRIWPYLLSFFGFISIHIGWLIAAPMFWVHLLSYVLLTAYLIYLYWRSGWNLVFPIAAHFLNNLAFFIVVFIKYKI